MRLAAVFLLALISAAPALAQQGEPCAPPRTEVSWNGSALTTSEAFDGYQWYLNGQPISGATSREYVPTESGDYQVAVSRRSASFEFVPTSRAEGRSNDFRIYPNPATGRVSLQLAEGPAGSLRVVDVQGRQILSQSIPAGSQNFDLDIQSLKTGIYYLQLERGNRRLVETLRVE